MLGQRIAALRRQAGISQAELASRLQISSSAVGMYEQGRREPSVDILLDMAEVFGVSLDYLLRGTPEPPEELAGLDSILRQKVALAENRARRRGDRPFSRQELAVLFAAMLMEG